MTVEKFTIDDECSVTINVDLGEIIKISSPTHPKAVRLHIPSVSPDGTKIKYVRSHAFEGSFGTVSFDDNIQFLNGAFFISPFGCLFLMCFYVFIIPCFRGFFKMLRGCVLRIQGNEKIVKPYYTSDSMFDEAFQGVAEYWASSKKY